MVSRPRTPTRIPSPLTASSSRTPQQYSNNQTMERPRSMSGNAGANVPLLVELIENQQYDEAIARVRENPTEASLAVSGSTGAHNSIMNQGNLALHEACKNQPPVEFIDVLLEANENAVRTKGQWGYLPLHFACCSRASPEVVAKLIVMYPSATRTKDDHEGTLPLHLAAKWGADDEVIMALLTVHPKASGVRDSSGKTPLEHANSLSSPHVREAVTRALRRAPILCAVSKAAMNKLAYESDAKLREVVEVYQDRMAQVKDKYEQDKTNKVALEVQLRKELWDEKERASNLSEKVALLSRELEENQREMDENKQMIQQIHGLTSGRKSLPQRETEHHSGVEQREQRDAPEAETREKRKDQKELAKNALREWVSAGASDPSEGNLRDDTEEMRDPPPPTPTRGNGPSPRSAAVATVKEWFSSETQEIAEPVESRRQTTGGHRQAGQNSRDKIESYRQPQHGFASTTPSAIRNPVPKHSNEQQAQRFHHQPTSSSTNDKNNNSLLNRSKSAPRSNAVLARRDMASRQSAPSGDYNSNSRSNSSSFVRPKTPLPERSATTQEFSHQRNLSHSYSSASSRLTPNLGNGGGFRQNQSNSSSTRGRYDSKSPGRPRENYSTAKAATSAYSHRIMDDGDETLTMDSKIEWE